MSQENVEVVRWAFAYEMYGRGDRAQAATYFAPDFYDLVEGKIRRIEIFLDREKAFEATALRK